MCITVKLICSYWGESMLKTFGQIRIGKQKHLKTFWTFLNMPWHFTLPFFLISLPKMNLLSPTVCWVSAFKTQLSCYLLKNIFIILSHGQSQTLPSSAPTVPRTPFNCRHDHTVLLSSVHISISGTSWLESLTVSTWGQGSDGLPLFPRASMFCHKRLSQFIWEIYSHNFFFPIAIGLKKKEFHMGHQSAFYFLLFLLVERQSALGGWEKVFTLKILHYIPDFPVK